MRLIAPIIARIVSLTPLGAIPSGAPSGAAVVFEASVSDQLLALMSAILCYPVEMRYNYSKTVLFLACVYGVMIGLFGSAERGIAALVWLVIIGLPIMMFKDWRSYRRERHQRMFRAR